MYIKHTTEHLSATPNNRVGELPHGSKGFRFGYSQRKCRKKKCFQCDLIAPTSGEFFTSSEGLGTLNFGEAAFYWVRCRSTVGLFPVAELDPWFKQNLFTLSSVEDRNFQLPDATEWLYYTIIFPPLTWGQLVVQAEYPSLFKIIAPSLLWTILCTDLSKHVDKNQKCLYIFV